MSDRDWAMNACFADAWDATGIRIGDIRQHMAVAAYIGLDERRLSAYAAMERLEPIE